MLDGAVMVAGPRALPGETRHPPAEAFVASKQVIQLVIVGVYRLSVSTGRLPLGKEGHSGDDSVASGMPYRQEHSRVRVCKRPVFPGLSGRRLLREEAL